MGWAALTGIVIVDVAYGEGSTNGADGTPPAAELGAGVLIAATVATDPIQAGHRPVTAETVNPATTAVAVITEATRRRNISCSSAMTLKPAGEGRPVPTIHPTGAARHWILRGEGM